MIDAHVHLREPGASHKETFLTGTAAALAGGVVALLDMPNNIPPITDAQTLEIKKRIAASSALCDYGFYLGATLHNSSTAAELASEVAGLKIYLGETYGSLYLQDLSTLIAHFQSWPSSKPIAVHAEGMLVAAVLALAALYNRRVHICHVSRAEEITLIKAAKERGLPVTCEVTPHHLFLSEEEAATLGPFGYMKPTLGSPKDREALWKNLGIIDIIASDHAPHTLEEKRGPEPPPGVPGLETTIPLLFTAMLEGRIARERLSELIFENPARIFGIKPPEARVEIELGPRRIISSAELKTRCGWTPFEGMEVRATVRRVFIRGQKAYEDGKILVHPGFGRPLFYGPYR
ncbi:MAG: amidohydrolase family protein [Anaerolineae bacterium]|nr:amidohydrolase family protein [Anaerolineae bacterium]